MIDVVCFKWKPALGYRSTWQYNAANEQVDEVILAEQDLLHRRPKRSKVIPGVGNFRFAGVVHAPPMLMESPDGGNGKNRAYPISPRR